MKLVKWWKNTPKRFTRIEKTKQKILWIYYYIRINLFSLNKENKEVKKTCCLSNLSYRKMKRGTKS